MKFGPKLRTKPAFPKFNAKLRLNFKKPVRLMKSSVKRETGMEKGLRRKPLVPRKKLIL